MSDSTSIAPLAVRQGFMTEPGLGAGNFLDHALAANPHRAVPFIYSDHDHRGQVVLRGHSLTDLAALRDRYATWYHANGVRPGEPVGIVVAEGLEPLIHFLALTALGAIPTMINDAMRPDVMVGYLEHVGVAGVVADDTTRLQFAYRNAPRSRPRFLAQAAEVRAYDAAAGRLPEVYPYRHEPDDIVALIHSSGTTGTPKSTTLGHRSFWDGKQARMERFPAEPYDRLMSLMPHTHAGGLSYFLTAVLLGLPTVIMSDWRRSVVEPVMEAFQPTMVASFPRTFVELATGELPVKGAAKVHSWFNTGDSAHYGHIRRLVQLGERPAGLIQSWLLPAGAAAGETLPGSQFIDGLGSSEMGMALFGQITSPETARADRCVGKAQAAVIKAAVLDENGAEVPDGTVGLLGVITPSRTPGYWNDSRLTRSFELNGYWLTGDVARRDAEGNFYHLDRTVDVIDTAHGPVYSLPIEEILIADCADLVQDCSVVGVPGPAGQRPIAVVRLQADAVGAAAEEVREKANKALADAGLATLAAVVIARTDADYPLGPTGKVLKRELRTRHAALFAG
ncbi:acyl--CoA ligase [Nonomuraea sp. NN258]|uniref:class I adenylate-forming enzyme family protein n=1 Tax=Nonomuraea antri TaxID=2730852 RepID=UPI0015696617|nr:class I adenylate-forming enzyme family protein [Nonomuraea antri]NRQ38555.1 acyl--CoA ligase [Nonomuraea antri]